MSGSVSRLLRVFLCHSSGDKPTVRKLYQRLNSEAWIDAWLDEEKLLPGQDWNLEIEKAVEAADVIIVCLTKNSVDKEGYIQLELRLVLNQADYKPEGTLFVIPARLEECELPRRLRRWQYADFFPEADRDRAYQRLLVSLRQRANNLGIATDKPKSGLPGFESKPDKSIPFFFGGGIPDPMNKRSLPWQINLRGVSFAWVPAGKTSLKSYPLKRKLGEEINIPYDFYISTLPISNEQYAAYQKFKGNERKQKDNLPVRGVPMKEAYAFCLWLRSMENFTIPRDFVVRLPNIYEWVKARTMPFMSSAFENVPIFDPGLLSRDDPEGRNTVLYVVIGPNLKRET